LSVYALIDEELIMTTIPYRAALIVGAGSGINASVARGLATAGLKVGVAARNIDKLASLAVETGAERFTVDASDPAAVAHLFEEADARIGAPDVVLYNASHGCTVRLRSLTRKRSAKRSRYRPSAVFWSSSRPHGG
jgi:NADP-dependent 3-hydroxy acid dehydrogenase YdfG